MRRLKKIQIIMSFSILGLTSTFVDPGREDMSSTDISDGHVCSICNMDFLELCDLVAHRKMCSAAMAAVTRKRTIDYDEEDKENVLTQPPNKRVILNGNMSDGEEELYDEIEGVSGSEEDVMMTGRQSGPLLSGSLSRFSEKIDSRRGSMSDKRSDSIDLSSPVDEDLAEDCTKKDSLGQNIPGYPDSNVKLERLDSTKVAVAQFAENNFPPNDLAMLLFSLQQQQLMQLQILQQLQSQLAAGITPSLQNLPAMLLPGASALMAPMTANSSPMMGNIAPSHLMSPPTNSVASIHSSLQNSPAINSTKSVITSIHNNSNSEMKKISVEHSENIEGKFQYNITISVG